MRTIRNTKTLTRIIKKGGKVVKRYRKVTKNTKTIRKVKKIVASDPLVETVPSSQNLDD